MKDSLLTIYHKLPFPLRSWAASARGLYLNTLRYGPETEGLIESAFVREKWSPDDWKKWQEERLSYLLRRAATNVPYYHALWTERRRGGDNSSWEYLENWPLLSKEDVRKAPRAFLATDCRPSRMFHEHTSGTTGKPLDLWFSRSTIRNWYALFEARWRRWYGVSRSDRWAILGGQLVTPVQQKRPPFWVWNAGLNQLYMSSYHLASGLIPFYLDALIKYDVKYLLGYASSLHSLAWGALQLKRQDLRMQVVVTNAEPLHDYQRAMVADAFQCPVYQSYGMTEIVAAASECEAKVLHVWPEVGITEILREGEKVPTGTEGELFCTGLLNFDMPLIRYQLGDCAVGGHVNGVCSCGRTLPTLGSIEGRTDDLLFTKDGRRIGRLDTVFKAHLPVREAQVVQESMDHVIVRYVPAPDYTSEAGRSIVNRLKARMGDVNVVLQRMDEIPRGPNGKFRAVICNIPQHDIHGLIGGKP